MKQVFSSVVSNVEVMPGVHLIWLDSPQIASLAQPGQFVMVRCGEDSLLRRPLSVHRVDAGKIALLFSVAGKGTQWLSQRQAGDSLDILGPLGNGFSIRPTSRNLLLVAGGIGIAPLRFLVDEAVIQKKEVTLLMGASSTVHLLPTKLSNQGLLTDGVLPWHITVIKVTEDGSGDYKGVVTQLIVDYIDKADQIFACGPMPMYQTMAQMAELKNKPVQVSLEIMMGCGRGLCYGCSIKTKQGMKKVCSDGPVFELDDILWG